MGVVRGSIPRESNFFALLLLLTNSECEHFLFVYLFFGTILWLIEVCCLYGVV